MNQVPFAFFTAYPVPEIARRLIGCTIHTYIEGQYTAGIITESEAYAVDDKACHCYAYRRSKRTAPMYLEGGHMYVYLCYGIHTLFNLVTNKEGIPEAVLIRSVEPKEGVEAMLKRRQLNQISPSLSSGPGNLSKAMGITTSISGLRLKEGLIWLEESKARMPEVGVATRVGVAYAQEDALRPWRFYSKDSVWVSKPVNHVQVCAL